MKPDKNIKIAVTALVLASCLTGPSPAAIAQGLVLEEVVVTARRREEKLQDVPIAITALSGDYARENNITYLEDIQYHAPGLRVMQSGASGQAPVVALRGQRPTEALIHLEPAAPFYFNEVVIAPSDGANIALFDLQDVQVLKGPQGTLFGRNSTGGAILITPARPGDEFGGYARLGLGDYDLFEAEFGVDAPATEALQFRLSGKMVERDGYQDNLYSDRGGIDEVWDESSRSLRLSLVAAVTDTLENHTIVNWDDSDPIGRRPNVAAVNPASPLGAVVLASIASGAIADQVALDDPWKVETDNADHFDEVESWFVTNTTTWELDAVTLKNIFGFRDVRHEQTLDVDGTGLALVGTPVGNPNSVDAESYSNEFQVQGQALAERLDWIAGLYYYEMDGTDITNTDNPRGLLVKVSRAKNRSAAVFLQGTYAIGEDWTVTLGARNSWDEREMSVINRNETLANPCINRTSAGDFLPEDNCAQENDEDWSAPTWLANATYRFTDATMGYASIATGYRAGGFNLRAYTPEELEPFDEEKVITYELGVKSDWSLGDMPVRSNLAVYQQDYDDIQRTTAIPDPTGAANLLTITSNAAEATIRGVDLELSLAPVDGLNVSFNYAYVDTEYDEYLDETTVSIIGEPTDLSGTQFLWIPDTQLTATVRYTLPLDSSIGEISLQGNIYYQSEMLRVNTSPAVPDEVENSVRKQDSYDVQNYQVDWRSVLGSGVDLSLYLKNATDEEYVVGGQTVLSQLGTALYNWGAPRTWGVNNAYNF